MSRTDARADAVGPSDVGPSDVGFSDVGPSDSGGPDAASTDAGTAVTGSVSGAVFGTAYAAIRGGMPDDPQTMVVFIADAPLSCAALMPGWDTHLPVGAHVVELKTFGRVAGTYPIATTDPTMTMAGQALANYATIQRPVPSETTATGGQVVIQRVGSDRSVQGTFALDFRFSDRVTGTFEATYCPTGTEP